jgi:peptide/nickel transport system permease protein
LTDDIVTPESAADSGDIEEKQLFLTPWQLVYRRFVNHKIAVAGLFVLVFMALFCYLGPLFYPYSETTMFYRNPDTGEEYTSAQSDKIGTAVLSSLERPSKDHIFGTTKMGQDMFARLMYGGRISLMVAFLVVIIEMIIGVAMGGIAGYYGKAPDTVIMRMVEVLSSIPFMPLMFILSALMIAFGISPENRIYYTMFVIALTSWTGAARMVRGTILSLREMDFMQAADAGGIRTRNKILRHLIPNTLPIIIVMATMDLGGIILAESTLSFLGVGVSAPFASWGNMVAAVTDTIVMVELPALWVAPGMCILLVVLAFNFVGDGLRDATDPRLKR